MNDQENLLIAKAQRGNVHAFEQLVHQYDTKIMSVIYNMVNDLEDARDIYQEVFIKVYRSIHKFQFQSEFYTWLFRIALNTCINFRKARSKRAYHSLDQLDELNSAITNLSSPSGPEKSVLDKELQQQIYRGISELSPKLKTVFVLKHYHGYKLVEIAELLQCSEGTVKNYMFRATQKMKSFLKAYIEV